MSEIVGFRIDGFMLSYRKCFLKSQAMCAGPVIPGSHSVNNEALFPNVGCCLTVLSDLWVD